MPAPVATLAPATTFSDACANLNRFVTVIAETWTQFTGFGWQGDPKAPTDYGSLLQAYVRSQLTGEPLPVSNQHSDRSIYGSPEGNLAYRFWHDVTHMRLGLGFELDDEIEVANVQLDVLRAAGFEPGSLEYELLHADTLGQTLAGAAIGSFPANQVCFARLSLESSLSKAIRAELEQES
jgi:hypothetical protein